MKTLDQFILDYTGKTKGYPTDSSYEGECLSIAKLYIQECLGISPPPSGTNSAYGYWSNFPDPLGTIFEKVPYEKGKQPSKGDLPIWKPTAGNKYGHIDIFVAAINDSTFTGFDQNYGGRHAHLQEHTYENIVGWLHLKGSPMDDLQERLLKDFGVKTLDELKTVWDKEMGYLADARKRVAELEETLKNDYVTKEWRDRQLADKEKECQQVLDQKTADWLNKQTELETELQKYKEKYGEIPSGSASDSMPIQKPFIQQLLDWLSGLFK